MNILVGASWAGGIVAIISLGLAHLRQGARDESQTEASLKSAVILLSGVVVLLAILVITVAMH